MHLRNVWVSGPRLLALWGTVTLATAVVACGGGGSSTSKEPSSPSGTPTGLKVDASIAGDVQGTVTLDGMAPKNALIKMAGADPICIRENRPRSSRKPIWSGATARRSATCSCT